MKIYKFCASWCGHCKRVHEHGAEVIDVDEKKNEALIDKYEVNALPTFVIDKGESFVKLESPDTDDEIDIWIANNS